MGKKKSSKKGKSSSKGKSKKSEKKLILHGSKKSKKKPEGFVVVKRKDGEIIYLETNIDRLFKMIEKKGRIKISEAAKKLNLSEDRIQEWGDILEEHKLIDMHYPPIGEGVMRPVKSKKETKKNEGKDR